MKTKLFAVLTIMIICFCSVACNASITLEDYVAKHPEIFDNMEISGESAAFNIEIQDNTIVCTYDLSDMPELNEEIATNSYNLDAINQALSNNSSTYSELCQSLEDEFDMENIMITVRYIYKGEPLCERSFKSGSIQETASS